MEEYRLIAVTKLPELEALLEEASNELQNCRLRWEIYECWNHIPTTDIDEEHLILLVDDQVIGQHQEEILHWRGEFSDCALIVICLHGVNARCQLMNHLQPCGFMSGQTLSRESVLETTLRGITYTAGRLQTIREREERMHSQKLEALGHMTAGIAHDFNNMLQIVYGQLDILRLTGQLPGDGEEVRELSMALEQMEGLVKRLLIFASGKGESKGSFSLGDSIASTLEILGRILPKTIEIELASPAQEILVKGDAKTFQQALLNICLNGAEAMPGGGLLNIEVEASTDHALIHITDHGKGMSADLIARIFDPFFSTKERSVQRGGGLGLSLTREIIVKMGGKLRASSEVGKGSTFVIEVPLAPKSDMTGKGDSDEIIVGAGRTILVVDDEETIRTYLESVLIRWGFAVELAETGVEALEIIGRRQRENCPPALVILDLSMPEMDGRECLDRLHDSQPELPITVASGYDLESEWDRLSALGAKGKIQKPFSLRSLNAMLREVLGSE